MVQENRILYVLSADEPTKKNKDPFGTVWLQIDEDDDVIDGYIQISPFEKAPVWQGLDDSECALHNGYSTEYGEIIDRRA